MNKRFERLKEIYDYSQTHTLKENMEKFNLSKAGIYRSINKYKRTLRMNNLYKFLVCEIQTPNIHAYYKLKEYNIDTIDKLVDLLQNHICYLHSINGIGIKATTYITDSLINKGYNINERLIFDILNNYKKPIKRKEITNEVINNIKNNPESISYTKEDFILKALEYNSDCIRFVESNYMSINICQEIICKYNNRIDYIEDYIKYYNLDLREIKSDYNNKITKIKLDSGYNFTTSPSDFDGEILNIFTLNNKNTKDE